MTWAASSSAHARRSGQWGLLFLGAAIGLLTENILHANNARDVENDARAGATTLAQALGARGSYLLYVLILAASYGIVLTIGAAGMSVL